MKEATMKSFKDDTRGAVMFVGVFFACFLIGSLWFMIGIGDAIVFRERAQEAADASAFGSAVIHAKGMNIIVFINLLIMVIVGIYLIMCLIVDVLLLAAAIAAIVPFIGWAAAVALFNAARTVDGFAKTYKSGMKVVVPVLDGAQVATGYLAPWVGALVGKKSGDKYGMTSIVMSPSMISGSTAGGAIGLASTVIQKFKGGTPAPAESSAGESSQAGYEKKIGLPVEGHPLKDMCVTVIEFLFDKLASLLGGGKFISKALGMVKGFVGGGIQALHCRASGSAGTTPASKVPTTPPKGSNDKAPKGAKDEDGNPVVQGALGAVGGVAGAIFSVYASDAIWGKDGPKKLIEGGENGASWMQVYSWTFGTEANTSFRNVKRAAYVFNATASKDFPTIYKT
jgi:hypothetical protein